MIIMLHRGHELCRNLKYQLHDIIRPGLDMELQTFAIRCYKDFHKGLGLRV